MIHTALWTEGLELREDQKVWRKSIHLHIDHGDIPLLLPPPPMALFPHSTLITKLAFDDCRRVVLLRIMN